MSKFLILSKADEFENKNLRFGPPKILGKSSKKYSIIRYRDLAENQNKELYLQSPGAILGSLEWGPSPDNEKIIDTAYIDLYLLEKRDANNFKRVINQLDLYLIGKIWEKRVQWGLPEKTPLIQIEKQWIPTLKLSSLDYTRSSLKFQIPVKYYSDSQYIEIDLFDQDNDELPMSLLKPEYSARGLILLKGIVQEGGFFYLDWELKQLKVWIPEQVFDSCQLSASEDEDDDPKPVWEYENNIEEFIEEAS